MNLARTSLLSLASTLVKLLSALVINKALALFVGPAGVATVGQFQNFFQSVMSLSQCGIVPGVTKYTAEFKSQPAVLYELFSTSLKITLSVTLIISVVIFSISEYLSSSLLGKKELSYIFKILSVSLFLYVLNSLALAVLNGLKEIKKYIAINISQSLIGLFLSLILIYNYSLDGVLLAIVLNQSIVFLFLIFKLRNHFVARFCFFTAKFNKEHAINLSKFSIMTLTSALCMPIALMLIRSEITLKFGEDFAGYWQGVWYISSMYLFSATTVLSTYFLPRYSEINCREELKKELFNAYKFITPILLAVTLLIYFMRESLVELLFSSDFSPMVELFFWQLVGDFIKICSWLLSFLLLSKSIVKVFVFLEIFTTITFVFLVKLCTNIMGIEGVVFAYSLNYFIYFLTLLLTVRHFFFNRRGNNVL
ncbi:O-antigen translocase [Pseudoalteromonas shioyasakiensis]|uniref:O-antigen translocase n=1 Tax=Pseudoalteromonas shioyasakiensis TaxID=1190813 RepID=A0ABT6U6H8_9GAMM|nr:MULTISPECIES: O-antigen translocase [Pseudoalteromonas]MDI4671271.1 O-antigen translocase [Pseudoalteromonas shioyasakiensis]MDI4673398.1 O-antigen translocase [Pseudoalteromonas shioyasakiensis]MDI4688180.1 O-antigen translocase [Pseudoalteromonas shioyasakiensis]MDI4706776.1 O-antigen translocase [Pseudoalteromonas shioyasakiensis]NUJ23492.1 O-antigen translocase [Pseudoalteromonas sp. 0802]